MAQIKYLLIFAFSKTKLKEQRCYNMKNYHAILVFLGLLIPSFVCGWHSYGHTKEQLLNDMDQALEKTLTLQTSVEITPDTIQTYLSNLQISDLRDNSFVYYAMRGKPSAICGKRQLWSNGKEECEYQSYASLSVFDIFGLSDQRLSLSLLSLSLLWGLLSIIWLRRSPVLAIVSVGGISLIDDRFYNRNRQQIHLTPMQEQLLKMFFASSNHSLSKQEICDALWPKKPDASDTLYTLIKRLKPILEEHGNLHITSERGKEYTLE